MRSDNIFDEKRCKNEIRNFYGITEIDGLAKFSSLELAACGALIEYVKATQFSRLTSLNYPKKYGELEYVEIDSSTMIGLEILKTQAGEHKNSLLHTIDYTLTSIGARLLKEYLISPLTSHIKINERLDLIEIFVMDSVLRAKLRSNLKSVKDLERSISRISLNRGEPIDVLRILASLKASLLLSEDLLQTDNKHICAMGVALLPSIELLKLLENAVLPSASKKSDGNFINPDFHQELRRFKDISENSSKLIEDLCSYYIEKTKISNLKINKNNLIGYFIEIPKSGSNKLCNEIFIHKQSLSSGVRYTTEKLQHIEAQIGAAEISYKKLEIEIFAQICQQIISHEKQLKKIASVIGKTDIITSFAELAIENNYIRPTLDDGNSLHIKGGRHPFVEKARDFVPNDVNFDEDERICLLTGPNMAGKSTFLRQNALIVILAQIGSFVPAQSAHIGVVDKIFSRIGASDNIAKGRSTFMVEMIETANIVNNSTAKSFVIFDELGRGTSTKDGIAIAQSVLEYLHEKIKCRTIFATHYHELCNLENKFHGVKCYSVEIKKWQDEIVFMYKIIPEKSSGSYGIHVAKLSGIPNEIIENAQKIAENITV